MDVGLLWLLVNSVDFVFFFLCFYMWIAGICGVLVTCWLDVI